MKSRSRQLYRSVFYHTELPTLTFDSQIYLPHRGQLYVAAKPLRTSDSKAQTPLVRFVVDLL